MLKALGNFFQDLCSDDEEFVNEVEIRGIYRRLNPRTDEAKVEREARHIAADINARINLDKRKEQRGE